MGGKFSRDKGKRGEREVIDDMQPAVDRVYAELRALYADKYHVDIGETPRLQRNTLQSDGGGFDIVGMEWLALEVKYHETLKLPEWWRQTVSQAKKGQLPVLCYRKNGSPFRVRMPYALEAAPFQRRKLLVVVDLSMEDFVDYFEHALYYRVGEALYKEYVELNNRG